MHMRTVRSFGGDKKTRNGLSDDVADRHPAIRRRTPHSRRLDLRSESLVKLDRESPSPSSQRLGFHRERTVPSRSNVVNTFPTVVEQNANMASGGLGRQIERLRGDDLTQAELGRRIGVSRERMGQIERGRVKWPEVDIFNAIARELGVPVTTLLRAAGADIPTTRFEDVEWIATQLTEEGVELFAALGRSLLPTMRRRLGNGSITTSHPSGSCRGSGTVRLRTTSTYTSSPSTIARPPVPGHPSLSPDDAGSMRHSLSQ